MADWEEAKNNTDVSSVLKSFWFTVVLSSVYINFPILMETRRENLNFLLATCHIQQAALLFLLREHHRHCDIKTIQYAGYPDIFPSEPDHNTT